VAIHVALYHRTQYTYDKAVGHGPHVVRLRPAPHCRTRILSYSQRITGGKHFLNWQQDPFSNWNARLVFPEPLKQLCVEIELVAEMAVYNPFDFFLEDSAAHFPLAYSPELKKELAPFLEPGVSTPRLMGLVKDCSQPRAAGPAQASSTQPAPANGAKVRTMDFLVGLNQRLQRTIKYLIRLEPGVQPPEDTLEKLSGSCRDSAWLLVHVLRHLGLASRFVSGYLIQLAPDQKPLDGPAGPPADFTDLHAWAEVYLPGAGWIGLDPTSGLLAGEGHLPLSCTPEPSSAAPVAGATDPCESKLHHEMRLTRIYESPRVTKPYTEEQWSRIDALGHAIDAELNRRDARLTMGGEPTFVSLDDPDGPEWNFTAASPRKRQLSGELLRRLAARFAPGALLHYGLGKWYPGEALPRWALAAYWRKDGVPVWKDPALIADEAKDYGFGPKEARALALRIALVLGVEPRFLLPGYEDVFYYTWKERRLPVNVTPGNSNLKDPSERERIARIFQNGLGEVVGYALPLRRMSGQDRPGWISGPWFQRDGDILWLIPGDSPMGLRLPLDSIPWVGEKDYPWIWPQDPTQKLPDLPREFSYPAGSNAAKQAFVAGAGAAMPPGYGPGQRAQRLGAPVESPEAPPKESAGPNRRPAQGESASWIVRTALCVEPREGRLHVFMPPVAATEDYLALLAGIETAVSNLGLSVVIEGEPPPRDPRLNKLAVTPDPGVIEVNLHPSKSWDELVERTTVLYEAARQTRLGTEKFMLDGRHTGTGGGNHIIIGGVFSSGLLRRPPGSTRPGTIRFTNSRLPFNTWTTSSAAIQTWLRGWPTGSFDTCWSMPAATPIAPSSASTSCMPPSRPAAASGCWNCGRSKCRPMPA
jgi:transglutaminase-like putative cysteine protease